MKALVAACALALTALLLSPANAAEPAYPTRTIKVLVPFPPGGVTDRGARLITQQLAATLGKPVVIENLPTGGGLVALDTVMNAAPDGYTLLFGSAGTLAIRPLLMRGQPVDPSAMTAVAAVSSSAQVLVATRETPVGDVRGLIAYAKAHPGELNYGSAIGIAPHLMMELFKIRTGTDIVHVAYKGGAEVLTDLIAGHIQLTINDKSLLLEPVRDGRLKALAVASAARWPELPDVPTMSEGGVGGFPTDISMGFLAPLHTPDAVVAKLNQAVNQGLASAELRQKYATMGIGTLHGTAAEFAKQLAEEGRGWVEIVRATGIKLEQ
jgi:tripartite-type tricarboxylate transporter receptor subunit TctC